MNIKYFVRTTDKSVVNYDLDYTEIKDTQHKYIDSYIEALELIDDYDAVLLEDDCVLCKNFKQEIETVIEKYPNTIINFFTAPSSYWTTHYTCIFDYNQCTYFPKGMTKKFAKLMKDKQNKVTFNSYGYLLRIVLQDLGIPHLIYRPNLVQHIDGVCGRTGLFMQRNTIYFKDYLDKIGVNMLEAYQPENRKKLQKLLDDDRAVWYKDINRKEKINKYAR